jgi:hypothetical protein
MGIRVFVLSSITASVLSPRLTPYTILVALFRNSIIFAWIVSLVSSLAGPIEETS